MALPAKTLKQAIENGLEDRTVSKDGISRDALEDHIISFLAEKFCAPVLKYQVGMPVNMNDLWFKISGKQL